VSCAADHGWTLGIGDEESAEFDDVLADPQRSASLSRGGVLVGLTFGLDARIPLKHVEHGRRSFFTIGARIGGMWAPPLENWTLSEGDKATGGPSTGLTGAYAGLAIGFGGGVVSN